GSGVRVFAEHGDEGDGGGDEGAHRRQRRDVPGEATRDLRAGTRDEHGRRERQQETDPGRGLHPRSVLSLSTSSSTLRRPRATIRPRPTTTSDAATAMTERAKICPSSRPCRREKAIRSRFAALSMISTESRMISGERRNMTPSAPVAKSSALRTTYHWMSGPCIALLPSRVRAEHHAADGGDQ